jgi:hypothetical protein
VKKEGGASSLDILRNISTRSTYFGRKPGKPCSFHGRSASERWRGAICQCMEITDVTKGGKLVTSPAA